MADFMTKTQRSRAMSAVRGTETEVERMLRSKLHRLGFRFRKNVTRLPGRPDIVLPKHRCVVFVHGCFWHHHQNCKRSKLPATRRAFWEKKITDNVKRDRSQASRLRGEGWRVLTVWECQLRQAATKDKVLGRLVSRIQNTHV